MKNTTLRMKNYILNKIILVMTSTLLLILIYDRPIVSKFIVNENFNFVSPKGNDIFVYYVMKETGQKKNLDETFKGFYKQVEYTKDDEELYYDFSNSKITNITDFNNKLDNIKFSKLNNIKCFVINTPCRRTPDLENFYPGDYKHNDDAENSKNIYDSNTGMNQTDVYNEDSSLVHRLIDTRAKLKRIDSHIDMPPSPFQSEPPLTKSPQIPPPPPLPTGNTSLNNSKKSPFSVPPPPPPPPPMPPVLSGDNKLKVTLKKKPAEKPIEPPKDLLVELQRAQNMRKEKMRQTNSIEHDRKSFYTDKDMTYSLKSRRKAMRSSTSSENEDSQESEERNIFRMRQLIKRSANQSQNKSSVQINTNKPECNSSQDKLKPELNQVQNIRAEKKIELGISKKEVLVETEDTKEKAFALFGARLKPTKKVPKPAININQSDDIFEKFKNKHNALMKQTDSIKDANENINLQTSDIKEPLNENLVSKEADLTPIISTPLYDNCTQKVSPVNSESGNPEITKDQEFDLSELEIELRVKETSSDQVSLIDIETGIKTETSVDQELNLGDQELNLGDQELNLGDQELNLTDQELNLGDHVAEVIPSNKKINLPPDIEDFAFEFFNNLFNDAIENIIDQNKISADEISLIDFDSDCNSLANLQYTNFEMIPKTSPFDLLTGDYNFDDLTTNNNQYLTFSADPSNTSSPLSGSYEHINNLLLRDFEDNTTVSLQDSGCETGISLIEVDPPKTVGDAIKNRTKLDFEKIDIEELIKRNKESNTTINKPTGLLESLKSTIADKYGDDSADDEKSESGNDSGWDD